MRVRAFLCLTLLCCACTSWPKPELTVRYEDGYTDLTSNIPLSEGVVVDVFPAPDAQLLSQIKASAFVETMTGSSANFTIADLEPRSGYDGARFAIYPDVLGAGDWFFVGFDNAPASEVVGREYGTRRYIRVRSKPSPTFRRVNICRVPPEGLLSSRVWAAIEFSENVNASSVESSVTVKLNGNGCSPAATGAPDVQSFGWECDNNQTAVDQLLISWSGTVLGTTDAVPVKLLTGADSHEWTLDPDADLDIGTCIEVWLQ